MAIPDSCLVPWDATPIRDRTVSPTLDHLLEVHMPDEPELFEVSSLDDTVIEVLLAHIGDLYNGTLSIVTTIHPDSLGYTLVLMDQEDGEMIAKAAGKTFLETVKALHERVVEFEEEEAAFVKSLTDDEDDEGD